MLDVSQWRIFDTAVFSIQLLLIGFWFKKWRREYPLVVAFTWAVALLLFITPQTLITYNRVLEESLGSLPRFWPWHFKLIPFGGGLGLSLNDILLGGMALLAFGEVLKRAAAIPFSILVCAGGLLMVSLIGYASIANNDAPLASRPLLYITRNLFFFGSGAIVGLVLAMEGRSRSGFRDFFGALVVLFLFSVIGYAALAPEYRWNRYVLNTIAVSIMPTQNSAFVGAFAVWLLWVAKELPRWMKLACILAAAVPWVGLFKYGMFYEGLALGVIIGAWLLSRLRVASPKMLGVSMMLCAVLLPLGGTLINYYRDIGDTQDYSVLTRYIQMKNVLDTLEQGGAFAKLFGIGWKQPYSVTERVLDDDNYAFSAEDPLEQGLAINVQLPVIQPLRSVGAAGVLLLGFCAFILVRRSRMTLGEPFRWALLVPAFFVSYLFSFGEFAADFVLLAAIWMFAALDFGRPVCGEVK